MCENDKYFAMKKITEEITMNKVLGIARNRTVLVAFALGFSLLIAGAASASELSASEFESMRKASDTYLSSGESPNITAQDLFSLLNDGDAANDPFVLSVRSPEQYAKGHIASAINFYWREAAKKENLDKLPKDRQIVVYCYTGHTASQVTSLLNILGYDAINLKFGMTSWTRNTDVAPKRYQEVKDAKDYPFVTGTEPGSW